VVPAENWAPQPFAASQSPNDGAHSSSVSWTIPRNTPSWLAVSGCCALWSAAARSRDHCSPSFATRTRAGFRRGGSLRAFQHVAPDQTDQLMQLLNDIQRRAR